MLSKIEDHIVREVLARTDDPYLACLAITLRRLFPKLTMQPINISNIISDIYVHVKKIDEENLNAAQNG